MSVVEAEIQTVEDMYRLIWTAIANKQPISAIYKERYRLFCPHRLGRNRLASSACFVISTVGIAKAVWRRWVHRKTGVVSFLRS